MEEFLIASRAIETECFETFSEKDLAALSALVARLRDHLIALQERVREGGARSD